MNIDYITFRDTGNAGDNLIGWALQGLLDKKFAVTPEWNVTHLTKEDYSKAQGRNVLFGPGGIVTGSPEKTEPDRMFLKHITNDLLDEWIADKKNIFCFGSGTNSSSTNRPFNEVSGALLNRLIGASQYMYLRGDADIEVLSRYVDRDIQYKMRFQPCPSIFLDKIWDIKARKRDRVAINLNFGQLTAEEARAHPIRRFVEHVRSHGLTPVLWANHHADFHDELGELFQGHYVYNSPRYDAAGMRKVRKVNKTSVFKNKAHQKDVLAADYNGFRFAYGKRLHGYLPFMSFGTVSTFLSPRAVRKRIPGQYFDAPQLSLPYEQSDPEGSVDRMIAHLDYAIANEASLRSQIAEHREKLWRLTENNLNEMQSLMEPAA